MVKREEKNFLQKAWSWLEQEAQKAQKAQREQAQKTLNWNKNFGGLGSRIKVSERGGTVYVRGPGRRRASAPVALLQGASVEKAGIGSVKLRLVGAGTELGSLEVLGTIGGGGASPAEDAAAWITDRCNRKANAESEAPPAPDKVVPPASTEDRIQQLQRLGELKASGVLTEDEFQREKQRILSGR